MLDKMTMDTKDIQTETICTGSPLDNAQRLYNKRKAYIKSGHPRGYDINVRQLKRQNKDLKKKFPDLK